VADPGEIDDLVLRVSCLAMRESPVHSAAGERSRRVVATGLWIDVPPGRESAIIVDAA
jgi:hypothetical protein